jgi:hypothetical protein
MYSCMQMHVVIASTKTTVDERVTRLFPARAR